MKVEKAIPAALAVGGRGAGGVGWHSDTARRGHTRCSAGRVFCIISSVGNLVSMVDWSD